MELTGNAPYLLELEINVRGADWGFRVLDRTPGPQNPPDSATNSETERTVVAIEVTEPGVASSSVLEATTGERLYFESSSSIQGRWSLLDPAGTVVENWFSYQDRLITVTQSGTWTLSFLADETGTGNGNLIVHRVPDDPVLDTSLGQTVRLSADIALINGDNLTMNFVRTGAVTLEWGQPDEGTVQKNLSGNTTYTVQVSGMHAFVLRGINEGVGSVQLSTE